MVDITFMPIFLKPNAVMNKAYLSQAPKKIVSLFMLVALEETHLNI